MYCIQFIAQWLVTAAVMHFVRRNMNSSTRILKCGLECVVLSKFSHELFDFGRIIFYSWHFLCETSVTASLKPTLNLKVEHLVMMNIEMYTLIHTKWSHTNTHTIWINWNFQSRLMIRISQSRAEQRDTRRIFCVTFFILLSAFPSHFHSNISS